MQAAARKKQILALQQLQEGVKTNLGGHTVVIEGTTYDGAGLQKLIAGALGSSQAVLDAQGALIDARASDATYQRFNGRTLKHLTTMLRIMFEKDSATLAEFGLAPRKERTPLTTQALLERSAKSRSTRKARNTLGSRQRKAITGNVVGVTIEVQRDGEGKKE